MNYPDSETESVSKLFNACLQGSGNISMLSCRVQSRCIMATELNVCVCFSKYFISHKDNYVIFTLHICTVVCQDIDLFIFIILYF